MSTPKCSRHRRPISSGKASPAEAQILIATSSREGREGLASIAP